ncbi:hypothetical protein BH23ACT11_BH23ACT11_26170 [soil metagenome]
MDSSGDQPIEENNGGRTRRRGWIIGGVVAAGLLMLTLAAVALVLLVGLGGSGGGGTVSGRENYDEEYVSGNGNQKIAVVPIEGRIAAAESEVAGQNLTTTPDGLRDALVQAEEDDNVQAVVLEINSPGGGVTASDQMHEHITEFKRSSNKPVVVSMGSTAASGGYWISTAADRIVANETTLTGSLGVFLPLLNFSKAAEKYGVTQSYVKSGKFKTMGSPWKDLTEQERKIFDSIVTQHYDNFVEVITEGRGLPEEKVREVADGRVYTGLQAKRLGLVDKLGDLQEAATVSRNLSDVKSATVVRYVQSPGLAEIFRARLTPKTPEAAYVVEAAGLNLEAKPYALYLPGR